MENIEDWCISRQLWWGHRIPAWYDENGNVYVASNEQEARKKYKLADDITLKQDEDVLDTWFSSALWPFSTLGWPHQTDRLKTFYPTSVLVTGFDIIFFWIARMIMMGLKFTKQPPFEKVYITGLIRDSHGKKMSKSKGNVLDPIDLIDGIELDALLEKRTSSLMQPAMAKKIAELTKKEFPNGIPAFGTDALRFTYCALASTGRDIRFDLGRVEGYRNFCNKLWNAARFVLSNTKGTEIGIKKKVKKLNLADRWILSRLQDTIEKAHTYFADYRFDLLAQTLHEFTWREYCDWYLELSKPVLYSDDVPEDEKIATRNTLLVVLESLLRLLHPIMPFITEEIWQRVSAVLGQKEETIMLQEYPIVDKTLIDESAISEIEWVKNVVTGIRNIRGEMDISPNKSIPVIFNKGSKSDKKHLDNNRKFLSTLAKLDSIKWLEDNEHPPVSATALVGNLEILIPMEDLIDKDAEIERLNKELLKLGKELERSEGKLGNENYVSKAPAEVVAKERARVKEVRGAIEKLEGQLGKIRGMLK